MLVPSTFQYAHAGKITFFTTGDGKRSCGDYLTASQGLAPNVFKTNRRADRVFVSENAAYDQWIYGFFSAMNFASALEGNKHPDVQVRNIELGAWIREWCGTRPDKTVMEAVTSFMRDRWSQANAPSAAVAPGGNIQQPSESASSRQSPAAGSTNAMFVSVVFQDNVSGTDTAAFLQAYKISGIEGPNANGLYRLRLSSPLPPDQLQQFLDSMKSQIRIVKTAVAG